MRIVDYKSGKAPKPRYADKALWQLRFYALLWRAHTGTTPALLRLIYLGGSEPQFLDHCPTDEELDTFAGEVVALWSQISDAFDRLDFPARPGPLCPWCPFQAMCPEGAQRTPRR